MLKIIDTGLKVQKCGQDLCNKNIFSQAGIFVLRTGHQTHIIDELPSIH